MVRFTYASIPGRQGKLCGRFCGFGKATVGKRLPNRPPIPSLWTSRTEVRLPERSVRVSVEERPSLVIVRW